MDDTIIKVEGLGKKYRIRHEQNERYTALRDVIARKAQNLFKPRVKGLRPPPVEDFWALKDVSFEVKRGEVLGIIGRNGAGKSTLLKILSRITEPTEGRVEMRGRVASLLEVGTGFHPELTGRENIYLNGAILGMSRSEIRRKFDEIVAFAEVEKFLDTPVKRYSSGMYVRLAFGVAAHLEPEILIVDEVLAVGDAEFQKKCLGKMDDVAKQEGRTVLFVSHNMSAVRSLCRSGLLLDRGNLRQSGSIGQVISEYSLGLNQNSTSCANPVIELGESLRITSLSLRPSSIMSGGAMSVELQLYPKMPTVIRDLSALIYSDAGVRVAIIDLRREGLAGLSLSVDPIDIQIDIRSLPLVEGDYHLGFFLATDDYNANYFDLASFTVTPSLSEGDTVPYATIHRGFVELAFSSELKRNKGGATLTGPTNCARTKVGSSNSSAAMLQEAFSCLTVTPAHCGSCRDLAHSDRHL